MIAVAMALGWASYTLILWGYCLVKGYNISVVQLVNPSHPYAGKWPPQQAGNVSVIPDGTPASLVNASFETDATQPSTAATTQGGNWSSTPGGSGIAADAATYVGHCYSYGGHPGTNGKGCWDCSSFVNWVLGHDLNVKLPGASTGGYSGTSHGPDTTMYLTFGKSVPGGVKAAQPGDLIVWPTHIGIALGGGKMISALNEKLGTQITTIPGGSPTGEVAVVRRVG